MTGATAIDPAIEPIAEIAARIGPHFLVSSEAQHVAPHLLLATQDHTVHPDLQHWASKRMGATVTKVASSHVPMLSQPDVVIDVIREAAAAVQKR